MKRTTIQRGPLVKGPASLGASSFRYSASKKLAEEDMKKTLDKVSEKKKRETTEVVISPDKNIVGQGYTQN